MNLPDDLKKFPTTKIVAAHALRYLLDHANGAESIVYDGRHEVWFLGWGGRAVVRRGKLYQLKSFRRFEYRSLDLLRDVPLDYNEMVLRFRDHVKGDDDG